MNKEGMDFDSHGLGVCKIACLVYSSCSRLCKSYATSVLAWWLFEQFVFTWHFDGLGEEFCTKLGEMVPRIR